MKLFVKSVLDKQVSVKVLLIVILICAFSFPLIAAASSTVQATLASHFVISYNGQVQNFSDVNGNSVYPLVYKGSTYLPVRATSEMLGAQVNWIPETNSVAIAYNTAVKDDETDPSEPFCP